MAVSAHRRDIAPDLFRGIVEQASDAMIFADREGLIGIWNRGAERIFGHTGPEALGLSLDIIIPERFRRAHWDGFNKAIETGHEKYAGQVMKTRSMHKDGNRLYVEMSFSLIRNAKGIVVGSLAIARDCTAQHTAGAAAGRVEPRL